MDDINQIIANLTPQDMDGIMYEMHKAYFKYREQKREKERIMNL